MQIILQKEDDGFFTVVVKKTKPTEGPTIVTRGVAKEGVPAVVEEACSVVGNGGVRPAEM